MAENACPVTRMRVCANTWPSCGYARVETEINKGASGHTSNQRDRKPRLVSELSTGSHASEWTPRLGPPVRDGVVSLTHSAAGRGEAPACAGASSGWWFYVALERPNNHSHALPSEFRLSVDGSVQLRESSQIVLLTLPGRVTT